MEPRGEPFAETLDRARQAVEAASEKQAIDIVLLDTRQVCDFADYFVLCNAESDRQTEAIRDGIDSRLNQEGITPLHREGDAASGWVLLDYGGVIVHIFTPSQRDYYQLDALWGRARPLVRIQ